jgi:hypothetical protein
MYNPQNNNSLGKEGMDTILQDYLRDNPSIQEAMDLFNVSKEQYMAAINATIGESQLLSDTVTTNIYGDLEKCKQ